VYHFTTPYPIRTADPGKPPLEQHFRVLFHEQREELRCHGFALERNGSVPSENETRNR
jgi:hypothetical protein